MSTTFVFDTGGLFAPHGVGRFAMDFAPESLVTLVQGLGYDALAFAVKDLQTARTPFVLLARALGYAGVPYVASNLHCAPYQHSVSIEISMKVFCVNG